MKTIVSKASLSASLLVLAALPMATLSLIAQKQAPPEGAPAKAFTVPAHETYTLSNGLKVTLVPYGNIPKVTISLAVGAGSIDEGRGHSGLASVSADLMQEGTTTLSSSELADAAARMGSTLDFNVSDDQTIAGLDVLSEFGPDAVKLLADVIEHPRLPESELPRLKNNHLRQIAIGSSRAQVIAVEHFRKILYGEHPYSIVLPSEDDVKKITLDDVKGYIAANFNAQRSHLYVAGRFDTAAIKKAIESSFGGWAKGGTASAKNPPSTQAHRVLDVTDRPGAPQSTLMIGLPVIPVNHPDAIALRVSNALLGGSFNSRIVANIREQKGYAYSPSSQVSDRYHDSYWVERADVTTQYTGASIHEILGEIKRLGSEPPAAQELKGIQNYISGVFIIQNSNRGALVSQFQTVDFQGLSDDYLKTFVGKVNALTPDDIKRVTAQYLKPQELTIVVVGDKSKISDQLTPYDAGKEL